MRERSGVGAGLVISAPHLSCDSVQGVREEDGEVEWVVEEGVSGMAEEERDETSIDDGVDEEEECEGEAGRGRGG